MLTQDQLDFMAKVEMDTCKHCGRVVLLGPPCCYNKLYDLYVASQKEVMWLRKVQSKQSKKLQKIQKEPTQILSPNLMTLSEAVIIVALVVGLLLLAML